MIRVRFTSTVIYETEGRNQGPEYVQNEEYELRDDFAQRWLQRGVAVRVDAASEPSAPRVPARAPRTSRATVVGGDGEDTVAGGDTPE